MADQSTSKPEPERVAQLREQITVKAKGGAA